MGVVAAVAVVEVVTRAKMTTMKSTMLVMEQMNVVPLGGVEVIDCGDEDDKSVSATVNKVP